MILNVIKHTYHKNGDQLIPTLSIVALRKTGYKTAFPHTFLRASKAGEMPRELRLPVFPANVFAGRELE